MYPSVTIDLEPENRDIYRTLDGQKLFGFRFEQEAAGWVPFAEQLPEEVWQRLLPDTPRQQAVRVGVPHPAADLSQAKTYAAQWAEQVWRKANTPITPRTSRDNTGASHED